jgi:hypothetical protein
MVVEGYGVLVFMGIYRVAGLDVWVWRGRLAGMADMADTLLIYPALT